MRLKSSLIKSFICFAIIALCADPVFSQGEKTGEVNWEGGFVSGIGYGTANPSGNPVRDRLMADRAAVVAAQRALLEVIKGVRIDSETLVENMMVKEDVIKSRVEGIVKGARIFNKKFERIDGAPMATVEMRLCLNNAGRDCRTGYTLSGALDLDQKAIPGHVPPKLFTPDAQPAAQPVKAPSRTPVYDASKPVTGIVFSLEGRFFERELLPVVITEKDNETFTVYSVKLVNPSVVRNYGIVRYAESAEAAKKIEYLGKNIMLIPVSQVTKNNMIVIDPADAKFLRESLRHDNDYLQKAKVAISAK